MAFKWVCAWCPYFNFSQTRFMDYPHFNLDCRMYFTSFDVIICMYEYLCESMQDICVLLNTWKCVIHVAIWICGQRGSSKPHWECWCLISGDSSWALSFTRLECRWYHFYMEMYICTYGHYAVYICTHVYRIVSIHMYIYVDMNVCVYNFACLYPSVWFCIS